MTDSSITSPLNVAVLVGSLRANSFSRMVLDTAVTVAPEHVKITEYQIGDIPLFNQDIEDVGNPDNVTALRNAVIEADGLLIITPEYNGSTPGGLKNAIDWLSRMPGDSALSGQKVGVIGLSPGGRAAESVRGQLQLMMTFISGGAYEPNLGIGEIATKAADGQVTDQPTVDEIAAWITGFANFLGAQ